MPQKNLKMNSSKNGLVIFPRVLYPIIMFIVLAVDIYILVNTLNMQKESYNCKCAQNWELKQVSNSIITIISLQVSLILLVLFVNFIYKHKILLVFAALIIIGLFLIKLYYIIMMLLMIRNLDKKNCLCVDPTFKTNLTYYAGIRTFLVVVGIISLISKIMLMNNKK
jgi:hypothetical protein